MDQKDLRYYGPFRQKHRGTGVIDLASGKRIKAKTLIAQRADASLLMFGSIPRFDLADLPEYNEISKVTGVLNDGRPFRLGGDLFFSTLTPRLFSKGVDATILILPGYCEIGNRSRLINGRASFRVENFLFRGTLPQTVHSDSGETTRLGILPLELDGHQITLEQVPDYEQAAIELRASKHAKATCTINAVFDSRYKIDDLEAIAEVLADAMSVARGTLVTWSSYEARDPETRECLTVYRAALTKTYNGNSPIPASEAQDTKRLLEQGYNSIRRRNTKSMRKAIRAYCEARQGPFIETRSLMIGVLVEYLSGIYNKPGVSDFYLDPEEFSTVATDLSTELLSWLEGRFASTKRRELKKMAARVKDLNRRPLSSKVSSFLATLDFKVVPDEIRLLEVTRNHLAHRMDFPDSTLRVSSYLKLLHLIDRVFLRLLDYRGSYTNMVTLAADIL